MNPRDLTGNTDGGLGRRNSNREHCSMVIRLLGDCVRKSSIFCLASCSSWRSGDETSSSASPVCDTDGDFCTRSLYAI